MRQKRYFPVLLSLLATVLLSACGGEKPVEVTATPLPTEEVKAAQANIIVSEFMEKNRSVIQDEDGDFSDWIELYNADSVSVSLKDWRISDSPEQKGWKFPDVIIEPGEYLLVFASNKEKEDSAELHADFAISADEGVYLKDANGTLVFEALCGGCDGDVAMVKRGEGFEKSLWATPGYENSNAGYITRQENMASPTGPLVINEAMSYDKSILGEDWIEIKNISDSPVELSEYWLSDDDDNYKLFRLPELKLAPGQCHVLLCGDDITGFAISSDGDQLFLSHEQQGLVDFCTLHSIPYGCSYGRNAGENGWFYMDSPSPDRDNAPGLRLVSQSPTSPSKDGVYENVDSVTVELAGPGSIRYTLDGSLPDESSAEYTGPISLTKTGVLRAVCIEDNALPSLPLTMSFIINEGHSLPVLSLSTDYPIEFWQMYNGRQKGIEQPGSLSLYREEDSFTIGCGISLNGETSIIMPKKNMALRFRDVYGDGVLEHDIYGGGVTEFTNLLLRSGQDFDYAIIRNELCQNLCEMAGLNVINQRSIYAILYINGEYSGIYTLKEKSNEQLYASIYGLNKDSVELEETEVAYGGPVYMDLIDFCIFNDMSIEENYRHFCDVADVDGLIDWLIIEGFCGNIDMTDGNLRYVRSGEHDGKWHFMFYDLDATFKISGPTYANVLTEYAYNSSQIGAIVYPLTKNAEFRDRLLTRAAELFSTVLTNETVLAEIDRLCAVVAPEVERDYARFTRTVEDWKHGLDELKGYITGYNWHQYAIDELCYSLGLDSEERAHYFGEIDGK